jgi:hypothetical protein
MRSAPILLSVVLALTAPAAVPFAADDPVPRENYGAFLEPEDQVLHGAGKTDVAGTELDEAFERYSRVLGEDRLPIVFTTFTGIGTGGGPYKDLRARLETVRKKGKQAVIPQIGVRLPTGSEVPTDQQVAKLVSGLKSLRVPVFLRVGVEINGSWHSPPFEPDAFKRSFQMIAEAIRKKKLPVALVWSVYPGFSATDSNAKWKYVEKFYPGDEHVDWWSCDIFSPGELTDPSRRKEIELFLNAAEKHRKPVMIGEATPRHVGADDAADWNKWFGPFFDLIHRRKGIKAHTYVNYDWTATSFRDWGNARLDPRRGHRPDPTVLKKYREELGRDLYLHAGAKLPKFMRVKSRKK